MKITPHRLAAAILVAVALMFFSPSEAPAAVYVGVRVGGSAASTTRPRRRGMGETLSRCGLDCSAQRVD